LRVFVSAALPAQGSGQDKSGCLGASEQGLAAVKLRPSRVEGALRGAEQVPGPLARARRRGWRRRWRQYVAGKALRNSGALRDRQRARRLGLGVFDDQRRFGRRGTHCRLNTTLVSNVAAASRVAANSRSSISRARLSAGVNPKTSGSTGRFSSGPLAQLTLTTPRGRREKCGRIPLESSRWKSRRAQLSASFGGA
jgi:hypothetical protein